MHLISLITMKKVRTDALFGFIVVASHHAGLPCDERTVS